jgi:hypothetical protein
MISYVELISEITNICFVRSYNGAAEEISEMSVFYSVLTWLIIQKDFIAFISCESFKSYINNDLRITVFFGLCLFSRILKD